MKKLTNWYSGLNIYLKFAPFLILYLTLCIVFGSKEPTSGDEGRYFWFANNLLNGFYSPPYPNFNIWNGPGYPVFLSVFLFLRIPPHIMILANGLLLYFSLIINYKTISIYATKKNSLHFTLLLGFYYPIFQSITLFYTESLAWFLISLVMFLYVKTVKQKTISWQLIFLTAGAMAYLAITKVMFGYVILCTFFISLFILSLPSFRQTAKKSALIFLLSLIFCIPYLIYTYQLTGKFFYWTNSGGMSLYTMSTPYSGEYGDWQSEKQLIENPNHAIFMDSVIKLEPLAKDEAFINAGLKNIRNNTKKYLTNYVSNIGRLLFFPSVNAPPTIFAYHAFVPNMFIVVFISIALVISVFHFRRIPQELIFLFLFIIIYLFGSSLLSVYRRMFYITIPFWVLFFSYVFSNFVSFKTKED